ncbi:MAG: hypothetical protein ACRDQB_01455 [Thermocrispum sp.]
MTDAVAPPGGEAAGGDPHQLVAILAQIADDCMQDAQELQALDNDGTRAIAHAEGMPTPAEMAEDHRTMAYRAKTFQYVHAEAVRAHEAMIAAGGPDDPAAYSAYEEVMARLMALIPDFGEPDLGT